jgi:hypothetical protein
MLYLPDIGGANREAAIDVALKTPLAEGAPSLQRRGNRRDWFPGGPGG